jgi:hypothetical protein
MAGRLAERHETRIEALVIGTSPGVVEFARAALEGSRAIAQLAPLEYPSISQLELAGELAVVADSG